MKKFLLYFLITLALLVFSGIAISITAGNNDGKTYFKNGAEAFKAQNYNAAITNFEKGLSVNPEVYEAYCLLGMSYGLKGNSQKSEEVLLKAVKKFPEKWNAYTFLGDIKRAQHQTPAAIEYYNKAMSLKSMPEENKPYFRSLIQKCIQEQKEYDSKTEDLTVDKINIALGSGWKKAYFKGTDKQWILEYGLNNEDVINYKWTKLITVNFFDDNTYGYTPDGFYEKFCALLKQTADSLNSTFSVKKLTSPPGEIYFEWSISGRSESEICRIFKQKSGLYIAHYAHKSSSFTAAERAEAIRILKSINEK